MEARFTQGTECNSFETTVGCLDFVDRNAIVISKQNTTRRKLNGPNPTEKLMVFSSDKELKFDKTLEFEQFKDEPIRYNRETYIKTIGAIGRVEEIKRDRQLRLWRTRMALAKDNNRKAVINELKKNEKLIRNENVKKRIRERLRMDQEKVVQSNNQKLSKLQEIIDASKEESEIESDREESEKEEIEDSEEGMNIE